LVWLRSICSITRGTITWSAHFWLTLSRGLSSLTLRGRDLLLSIGPVILLIIGRVYWGSPWLLPIVLVVVPLVSIVLSVIVVVLLTCSCSSICLVNGSSFGLSPFLGYCFWLRLITLYRGLLTLPWILLVATLIVLIVLIIVVLILLLLLLLVILTSGLLTVIVPTRLVILRLLLLLVCALLTSILWLLYFIFLASMDLTFRLSIFGVLSPPGKLHRVVS
jgi:hypothetical protein